VSSSPEDATPVEPDSGDAAPQSSDSPQVAFRFAKSQFCRSIVAHGTWGGVSPHGGVHMAFYSERLALPLSITMTTNPEEEGLKEVSRQTTGGYVRDIEVEVFMSRPNAIALRNWLNQKLDEEEKILNENRREL
jgi:hypothetical protein